MSKYLVISRTSELYRIPIDHIVYMKADGNYTYIYLATSSHLADKKKNELFVTLQLGKIHDMMSCQLTAEELHPFARTKSYIINLNFLFSIDMQSQKTHLVLSDCSDFSYEIAMSQDLLKKIKDRIDNQIDNSDE